MLESPAPSTIPNADGGLVCAYVLDGRGGARRLDWAGLRAWSPADGPLWVHLERGESRAATWLIDEAAVPEMVAQTLMADGSRPRAERVGDALRVNVRGVNLNPGSNPEDMVSLRIWAEAGRIITVRRPKLMAVQDVRDALEAGAGPIDVAQLLLDLTERLLDRIGPEVFRMEEEVDQLEEQVLEGKKQDTRRALSKSRREAIGLRRYLTPQREVLGRLTSLPVTWLTEDHRSRLREQQDRLTRYVEDLDAVRERAAVTQEEFAARLSEDMNRTMYLLSIVAAIFLPLAFVTGLLGINVGGIPGSSTQAAFAVVVIALVGLAVLELAIFRWMRWF